MDLDILRSESLIKALWSAKITKVGHLITERGWISAETLALKLGMRSVRVAEKLLTQIRESLPLDFRLSLETSDVDSPPFPETALLFDTGEWQEMEGNSHFRTPELSRFGDVGKKALYVLCVKVTHFHTLENVKESKWQEFFGMGASPKGC